MRFYCRKLEDNQQVTERSFSLNIPAGEAETFMLTWLQDLKPWSIHPILQAGLS